MSFLRFMARNGPETLVRIAVLLAASAIANAVLLIVLLATVRSVSVMPITQQVALYAGSFLVFVYSLRFAGGKMIVLVEDVLAAQRVQAAMHDSGKDRVVALDAVVQAAGGLPIIAMGAQSAVAILLTLGYFAYVSAMAFVIGGGFLALCLVVYDDRRRVQAVQTEKAEKAADETATARRSGDREWLARALLAEARARADASYRHFDMVIFPLLAVFALAPIAVFIVPELGGLNRQDANTLLTATFFITGPVALLAEAIPLHVHLEAALARLEALDEAETAGDAP